MQMLSKMLKMPVKITPPLREKQRQQRSGHCGQTQHMLAIIITMVKINNFQNRTLSSLSSYDRLK